MRLAAVSISVLFGQLGQVWAVPVQDSAASTLSNIQKRGIRWDWDESKPNGDKQVEIASAFSVALQMVGHAYDGGKDDYFSDVYRRYFQADTEWSGIYAVWERIIGPLDGDRRSGAGLNSVIISNADWKDDDCDRKEVLGWADNRSVDGVPGCIIKLCDKAYEFPQAYDIKCDDLDDVVSKKMSTISGIFIHELTHCQQIGQVALGGNAIVDHNTDGRKEGYGPRNVVKNGNGNMFKSLINADNYRWLATEMYWRAQCPARGGFGVATSNQDFAKCDTEDGECVIQ